MAIIPAAVLLSLGRQIGGAVVQGAVNAMAKLLGQRKPEDRLKELLDVGAGEQGPPMPLTYKDVEWQQQQIRSASRPAAVILAERAQATGKPQPDADRPVPPPRKPRK